MRLASVEREMVSGRRLSNQYGTASRSDDSVFQGQFVASLAGHQPWTSSGDYAEWTAADGSTIPLRPRVTAHRDCKRPLRPLKTGSYGVKVPFVAFEASRDGAIPVKFS